MIAWRNVSLTILLLLIAFYIWAIIAGLTCGIRRMHDVGKSGWFILIPIYDLILACTQGVKGENEYGTEPNDNV